MKLLNLLKHYKNLARKNLQLNVGTFDEMYKKLKICIKDKSKLVEITKIYESHKVQRDGCDINSLGIDYAINEMMAAL